MCNGRPVAAGGRAVYAEFALGLPTHHDDSALSLHVCCASSRWLGGSVCLLFPYFFGRHVYLQNVNARVTFTYCVLCTVGDLIVCRVFRWFHDFVTPQFPKHVAWIACISQYI